VERIVNGEVPSNTQPIQVEGLRFGYAAGFSLDVPDLSIEPGERVALTGTSGSGKTTLLHLVAGILAPQAGQIEVAGLDLSRLSVEERQDLRILRLGLVFQEFELLEYLNVFDNVLLPYRLSPLLEVNGEVHARAEALLADMGIGDKAGRRPDQLSQGERQRVAVCRALVTEPAVLLGDEPTANLDPGHRDHVLGSMLEYGRKTGAPVLVVTHDHEVLERFDRVVDIAEVVVA
jgi:putative ABC transport system ATP-binding protein